MNLFPVDALDCFVEFQGDFTLMFAVHLLNTFDQSCFPPPPVTSSSSIAKLSICLHSVAIMAWICMVPWGSSNIIVRAVFDSSFIDLHLRRWWSMVWNLNMQINRLMKWFVWATVRLLFWSWQLAAVSYKSLFCAWSTSPSLVLS